MTVVACTLLADGSSDRVLQPILRWLLDAHCPHPHAIEYAPIHQGGMQQRIARALSDFPCDVLFVHRDAERQDPALRLGEVTAGWTDIPGGPKLVAVIPVRMTEAWLLFDEAAIRRAAGNPNGTVALDLPKPTQIEQLPDPKETLFDALRRATGLPPQRLRRFQPETCRLRVADLVADADFSPLRQLPAFRRLESNVQAVFHN